MPQKVFLYASLREGYQKLARFIVTNNLRKLSYELIQKLPGVASKN